MTTRSKTSAQTKKRTAVAKKTAVRSTRAKKSTIKSFRLSREQHPFVSMQTSKETLYWVILGVLVICFAAWILKLQSDINEIYDRIDASVSTSSTMNHPVEHRSMRH